MGDGEDDNNKVEKQDDGSRSVSRHHSRSRSHRHRHRSRSRSRGRDRDRDRHKKKKSSKKRKKNKKSSSSSPSRSRKRSTDRRSKSHKRKKSRSRRRHDSSDSDSSRSSSSSSSSSASSVRSRRSTKSKDSNASKHDAEKIKELISAATTQENTIIAPEVTIGLERRLYVGNLPNGITAEALEEFLELALKNFDVGDAPNGKYIKNCRLGSDGHYAFVEFITVPITEAVCGLDKLIPCLGNPLKIGRPKGYQKFVEENKKSVTDNNQELITQLEKQIHEAEATIAQNQQEQQQLSSLESDTVRIENIITSVAFQDKQELSEIEQDVKEELEAFGTVKEIVMPSSKEDLGIIATMSSTEEARKVHKDMNKRTFDGVRLKCEFIIEKK